MAHRVVRGLAVALGLSVCVGALGGCASSNSGLSIATTSPGGASEQIPAEIFTPDGPRPFPAVVIVHDCSGVGHASSGAPDRWARELVKHGYVILIPDSFTTRGHPDGVCTDASPRRRDVSPARRVRDAYATLAYLRTLPYVDGRRVGLMGGSHGGSTTLASMVEPEGEEDALSQDRRAGFAAAVALYPGCAMRLGKWRADSSGVYRAVAPLLILVGEKDDWTPAEPVTIKVYPGAHHSFDSYKPVKYVASRVNQNSPTGRGATTGGDPAPWADSIREVIAFFGQHLK